MARNSQASHGVVHYNKFTVIFFIRFLTKSIFLSKILNGADFGVKDCHIYGVLFSGGLPGAHRFLMGEHN